MRGASRSAIVIAIPIAVGLAVAASSSCTFNLPSDTCDPTKLHGGPLMGPVSGDSVCNRCLEDQCCEKVGNCDHATRCMDTVSAVHACVIDAGRMGAQSEDGCAMHEMLGQSPAADQTYRCMRDSCGNECGLPVCKVDPAARVIQSAGCDRCIASSCCSELNACYANRACKLMIECIVNDCGRQLGEGLLEDPLQGPLDAGDVAAFDACAPPSAVNGAHAPPCVGSCLCEYMFNDPGLAPSTDEQRPALLARAVYTCAQQAKCGQPCVDGFDAGPDAPSDATADGP